MTVASPARARCRRRAAGCQSAPPVRVGRPEDAARAGWPELDQSLIDRHLPRARPHTERSAAIAARPRLLCDTAQAPRTRAGLRGSSCCRPCGRFDRVERVGAWRRGGAVRDARLHVTGGCWGSCRWHPDCGAGRSNCSRNPVDVRGLGPVGVRFVHRRGGVRGRQHSAGWSCGGTGRRSRHSAGTGTSCRSRPPITRRPMSPSGCWPRCRWTAFPRTWRSGCRWHAPARE